MLGAAGRVIAERAARNQRHVRRQERERARFGVLLALPAVLAFSFIIAYPLLRSMTMAFFETSLLRHGARWVGLYNFQRLVVSGDFQRLLLNTLVFVLGTTALGMLLALTWALVLNEKFRGRDVLRGLSLVPWIVPSTVIGFLWLWLFHGQFGVVNGALRALGVLQRGIVWLGSPAWARMVLILARAWQALPWYTLLILAALQALDRQQTEAARVDGASNFRVLTAIVLPQIRSVLLLAMMLALIGNIQHFDLIWVMTGGGPAGATATFSVEVYQQAFQKWDTGSAAALGVFWTGLISILAWFYLSHLEGRE